MFPFFNPGSVNPNGNPPPASMQMMNPGKFPLNPQMIMPFSYPVFPIQQSPMNFNQFPQNPAQLLNQNMLSGLGFPNQMQILNPFFQMPMQMPNFNNQVLPGNLNMYQNLAYANTQQVIGVQAFAPLPLQNTPPNFNCAAGRPQGNKTNPPPLGPNNHIGVSQHNNSFVRNTNQQGSQNRSIPLNYTEQEIKQWREARQKNYPTKANIEKLKEKQKDPEASKKDAVLRCQQMKEILAKQAELGYKVAEIPSSYFSDSQRVVEMTQDEIMAVEKEQVTLRERASNHVQKPQSGDLKPSLIRDHESPSTRSRFKRKATKLEPDDSLEEPVSNQDSITCLAVTNNSDFLELPERLPYPKFTRGRGNVDNNRCGIELLDPKRRRSIPLNYTEQEIQQWREARQKNYPTKANIEKLKQKQKDPEVSKKDAVLRCQQLKEILAKQAELGCKVAEIPSSYFSDSQRVVGMTGDEIMAVKKEQVTLVERASNHVQMPQVHPINTRDEIMPVKKEQVTLREITSNHVQKPQDLNPFWIRDNKDPSTRSRFKWKAIKLEPDDSLDEPISVKLEPDDSLDEPISIRLEPDDSLDEPISIRLEPDDSLDEPISIKLEPDDSLDEPISIKLEPDDSLDEPISNLDSITCLAVTDKRDFLELPERKCG